MNIILSGNIMLWALFIYAVISVFIVAGMLVISYFLGQRSKTPFANKPYESGIEVTGSARLRFPSKFYLVAIIFVLFDIESVFIIAWAISFKELGWPGYFGILVFIAILFVILFYEWRVGVLNIGPSGEKIIKAFFQRKGSGSQV